MRRTCALAGAMAATLMIAPPLAVAAAQRTFVAADGLDGNPCTLAQPCRSFAAAIAQTTVGGEVIVLDSAGYGPATVTTAVSIIAPPGIHAGISVSSGDGITVNAGPNDVVVLRGLSIVGQGGGNGVLVNSAKEVHIEDCTISNMQVEGIYVNGSAYVRIAGTTLRSNALSGVFVPPGVATTLTIDETHAVRNGQVGYFLRGVSQVTLRNSTALDNTSHGMLITPPSGVPKVIVTNGEYSGNGGGGIFVTATDSTEARLSIHGTSASRNAADGVLTSANGSSGPSVVSASISASHLTWNSGSGVWTGSVFTNVNRVVVTHSAVSENGVYGVLANGAPGTVVSVSANMIARNADFDLAEANAGSLLTFGNNALTGNGGGDVQGSPSSRSLR